MAYCMDGVFNGHMVQKDDPEKFLKELQDYCKDSNEISLYEWMKLWGEKPLNLNLERSLGFRFKEITGSWGMSRDGQLKLFIIHMTDFDYFGIHKEEP